MRAQPAPKAAERNVVAFENPMYSDSAQGSAGVVFDHEEVWQAGVSHMKPLSVWVPAPSHPQYAPDTRLMCLSALHT